MDCAELNITATEPSTNMSKIEITLRLEKEQMAAIIQRLSAEIAAAHSTKVESREEPPAKLATFPARALRYQIQRIGLFTPGPMV